MKCVSLFLVVCNVVCCTVAVRCGAMLNDAARQTTTTTTGSLAMRSRSSRATATWKYRNIRCYTMRQTPPPQNPSAPEIYGTRDTQRLKIYFTHPLVCVCVCVFMSTAIHWWTGGGGGGGAHKVNNDGTTKFRTSNTTLDALTNGKKKLATDVSPLNGTIPPHRDAARNHA